MAKTADEIIEFATYSQPARSRVRVYASGGGTTVLATELMEDNGGPSITNAAERLWAAVVEKFGMNLPGTTFVEHYRKREGETFDVVAFERRGFERPNWSRISRAVLEELIGEPWLDACVAAEVRPERRQEDPDALPSFHYRVIIHNFRFSGNSVVPEHQEVLASPELDQAHILRNETACVMLSNPGMARTEIIWQLRAWAQPRFATPIDGSDCDPFRILTAAEQQLEQPGAACTICGSECVSLRSLRAELCGW
jgi:hypothetical protein